MMKTASVLALVAAVLAFAPATAQAGLKIGGITDKTPVLTQGVGAKPIIHLDVPLIKLPHSDPSDPPGGSDEPSDPPGGSDGSENTDPPGGDSDGNPFTP